VNFERTSVFNLDGAIRGMRNPMNSWDKSDSKWGETRMGRVTVHDRFIIGENDLKLAQSLIKAGTDHSKFMRQIMVSVDITAPLYWWKEFDTYKVGTVANSTSTMHKLASTEITPDCFAFDSVHPSDQQDICTLLEGHRSLYQETQDKKYWRGLIQLLPSSWLQTRTVTMSYQNVRAMFIARNNHKLSEWKVDFANWVRTLQYAEDLIMIGGN
jgi:hypothetical protein